MTAAPPSLGTTRISRIIGVCDKTICNWIDAGKLKSYRLAGKTRRVKVADLVAFMKVSGMDVPKELEAKS
jgi:excisionase family DNA binding protein